MRTPLNPTQCHSFPRQPTSYAVVVLPLSQRRGTQSPLSSTIHTPQLISQTHCKRTFLKPSTLSSVLSAAAATATGTKPQAPPARHLTHTRTIPYPRSAIFEAIISVDRYPEFLPFVLSANVLSREKRESRNDDTTIRVPTRAVVKVGYETFGIEEDWESVITSEHEGADEGDKERWRRSWIEAQSADDTNGHGRGVFESLKARWELCDRPRDQQGMNSQRVSEIEDSTTAAATAAIGHKKDTTNTSSAQTSVKLDLQVRFRSPIYDRLFAEVEGKVARIMVGAFEERVKRLVTTTT